MSYSLGSATITPGVKGTFTAVNSGIQGIVIGNLSGYSLSVQLEGGATAKTLYPGTADFFPWFTGFSGVIFWTTTSTVNVQNIPGASITFDAVGKIENFNSSAYPMSIAVVQSVNPTATGNPLFTTIFGLGSTTGNNQSLNVFNPATSGVIMAFHSARCSSNSVGIPTVNLIYLTGADLNLPTADTAICHTLTANPPVSVAHVTAEDTNASHGGVAVEVLRSPGRTTQAYVDLLAFPDVVYLNPGGNLRLSLADTTTGNTIELALKWSEQTQIPPNIVTGGLAVAQQVINNNQPVGTQLIESTPTGAPQALNIFNDGSGSWSVDQSGIAHQVFKFNTAGNPLQLGQAGDISEVLGQLTVDQLVTLIGNLVAGGGVNVNTIRDNVTGTTQITLTTAGMTISNILTLLSTLAMNTPGTNFPSGTSGSATLYQFMVGTLKLAIVTLTSWAKTTAGDSVVSFPTAFATLMGISFGSGPFHINNGSGVNQTVNNLSTLPTVAGNAGTTVNGTVGSNSNNIFECQTGTVAQFALFGSQTGPFTGIVVMIGT